MISRTNGCLWNQDRFNLVNITSVHVVRHLYKLTSFCNINGTEIELLRVVNAFTINSNTTLVHRLPTVEHLNPPLIRNTEGQWEVSVMSPKTETLDQGQSYLLRLKAKYNQGSLSLTVV